MRELLLIILFLFPIPTIYGQEANIFIKQRDYNFGRINDKKCTVNCHYANDTGHEVVIQAVYTSCGCVSVVYPKKPIKDKEHGKIEVSVDFANEHGYFEKKVLLYVSSLKPIILKIKGFKN